jgi:hypothetical protein
VLNGPPIPFLFDYIKVNDYDDGNRV